MLVDGYRLVYERTVEIDLHLIDPEVPDRVLEEVNRTEEMIVKILVRVSQLSLSLKASCLTKKFLLCVGRRRQLLNGQGGNSQSPRLLLPLRALM